MTRIKLITMTALACLWIGCGGDDRVSPAAAADQVASALCDWLEECGQWEIRCDDGDGCTADRVEVDRADCIADRALQGLDDGDCGDLTDEQVALLDECVDGLAARACITQADIDAYLVALERGDAPDEPGEPTPAACLDLEDLFAECAAPTDEAGAAAAP
jgi:hypothetical protein